VALFQNIEDVMRILGVDYGTNGAFALIDTETEEHEIWDMPLEDGEIDVVKVGEILDKRDWCLDVIWIEHVIANGPNAGKKGLLKQGKNIGKAEAMLILFSNKYNWPMKDVSGQRWTRFQGLWGKDKKNHVLKAIEKYPMLKSLMYGPKGGPKDGRADALLIADYGRYNNE